MAPIILGAMAALILLPVIHDAIRRPAFRRLAVRSAARRPTEAALVVGGAMLATAIITSSFVVGDTIDNSIRDIARTDLGPIDIFVGVDQPSERATAEAVDAAVRATPIDGTDGIITLVGSGAAVQTQGTDRRAEPRVALIEADFDEARAFGGDPGATGLADAGPTPTTGFAAVSQVLADKLDASVGDRISVYASGTALDLEVQSTLPHLGLAGADRIFVEPGTIERVLAASGDPDASPSRDLLISLTGGVYDSTDNSEAVVAELERRIEGIEDGYVEGVKADLFEDAAADGNEFSTLFAGIGSFSVIAGILLLVNLMVMLAEERKSELGMMRAVGMKRNHLLRIAGIEGGLYSITAAVIGAIVGVGLGWLVVKMVFSIFIGSDGGLTFSFAVDRSSLVMGFLIGLIVSQLTVWATNARIVRLNIISAIRELPDPRRTRRWGPLVLGIAGIALGALLTLNGFASSEPHSVLAGPAIAAFALVPLASRIFGVKPTMVLLSVPVLIWGLAAFAIAEEAMDSSGISVFVVQGVILVTAAVAFLSSFDKLWTAIAARLGRSGMLAGRIGLAYPLARPARTGLLLGMFALVVFTMVFMSSFVSVFNSQRDGFVAAGNAGHDLYIDSVEDNPVTVDQLEALSIVDGVTPLVRSWAYFTPSELAVDPDADPDAERDSEWAMQGFDERMLERGVPELADRDDAYADDRSVYEAILADPSLIVVNDFFLGDGGGPGGERIGVGDQLSMSDPVSGRSREITIVGVMSADFNFSGSFGSRELMTEVLGSSVVERRHYVTLADGVDAADAVGILQSELLPHGAIATTFAENVDDELQESNAFMTLMRGYLGLGLIIGIAGLGVVMIRAVRERRRQIGMVRAMGLDAGTVRNAFMVESTFIAAQGLAIGSALGVLTGWCVLTYSTVFGEQKLDFVIPWTAIAVIILVPLAASMVATAAPAIRAAKIHPAAALRVAD